jgi:HlyD family secretion protein
MAYCCTAYGVDKIIKKKKWTTRRIVMIAGIAGIVLLIVGSVYFTSGKNSLNVNAEHITVSEVKKGVFQENIPVNGIVLPLTSIYLDAQEGGRVEEKFVEDGAIMKKGQPILRLSNTDLLMTMMSQQSVVYNTLTQMQINRNAAQQNTVSKLNQMADVESQLKEAERIHNLNKKLYAEKVIGQQEYLKSKNDYQYYLEKQKLSKRILEQDSLSVQQQLSQDKQSFSAAREALNMMEKKVGDLIVRSPVDGQLTSLDAEIGQNKNKGERLGQIDVLGGFKVRADIDEHYISRIYNGLSGSFDFAGKNYKLTIKKVYTQVTAGRFQVDMEFEGKVPEGIRRGQTVQILLALSDEKQALLLPRGGFYQQTGGNWIFKLSGNGNKAYKVDIQLGNQNTQYYEVLTGLEEGDKVVTSSYENYGNREELILK